MVLTERHTTIPILNLYNNLNLMLHVTFHRIWVYIYIFGYVQISQLITIIFFIIKKIILITYSPFI